MTGCHIRTGKQMRQYLFAAVCTILLPWLINGCMLGCLGHGMLDVVPYFNDEVNYWHLICDMLEYEKPIGYMGFYGTHAPVGTFGFHGFVILLPYYLFAKVFGLHFYTLAVCNITLVSLALFFYIVLLRPPVRSMLTAGLLVALPSMVSKFYSTSMLEGLNVFLAVVFAVLFVKILDTGRKRYMAAAWTLMAFAVLAKVTWVICVPPLAMVCLRGGMRRRVCLSAVLTAVISLVGYRVYALFSAPYYQSKFMDFQQVFAERGIWKGAVIMARETVYDLFRPMLIALRGQDGEGSLEVLNGLLLYGMFAVLTVWILRLFRIRYGKKRDVTEEKGPTGRQIVLLSAAWAVMAMDLAGVALLYMPIQTIRTAFHSYLFAVVLLTEWERGQASGKPAAWLRCLSAGLAVVSLVSTVVLCVTGDGFGEKLYLTEEFRAEYEETRTFLSCYIHLDESREGWENTVAYMEGVPEIYWMCMPPGTGLNYHVWLSPAYPERWAIIRIEPQGVYDFDTIYSSFTEAGYEEIARDARVILLEKQE